MTLRGLVTKVLKSLEKEEAIKFCMAPILGSSKYLSPVKYKQQPNAALSVAATSPLQKPLIPSWEYMYLQEVAILLSVLPCWWRDSSLWGGIMSAIFMFSKGWRRTVVTTPLIIPYTPFSLIIYNYNIPQSQSVLVSLLIISSDYFTFPMISFDLIIIMSKKHIKKQLQKYFLLSSPFNMHASLARIVTFSPSSSKQPLKIPTNRQYVSRFLSRFEIFGPSVSQIQMQPYFSQFHINKVCSMQRVSAIKPVSLQQSDQILMNIRDITDKNGDSFIYYQQLQQRLLFASNESVKIVKAKLSYLFKILLNKRTKIAPQSLQMELNISLSRAILHAFERSIEEYNKQWKKFESMQKIMRAIEYMKKGDLQIALSNFTQIFKDESALTKTRQQALEMLCQNSEQKNDTTILQPLLSLAHEKGEREYEEYIRLTIQRIKHQNKQIRKDNDSD